MRLCVLVIVLACCGTLWCQKSFSDKQIVKTFPGAICASFSPDGTKLAIGDAAGKINIWHVNSWKQVMDFAVPLHRAYDLSFSLDGKKLASCGEGNHLYLWDLQTKASQPTLSFSFKRGGNATSCTFSPDSKFVVLSTRHHYDRCGRFAYGENSILMYSLQTSKQIWKHHDGAFDIAFSHNGKYFASCGADKMVYIWDNQTRKQTVAIKGHTSSVNCIDFSQDDKSIASGSNDQTARMWDATTGKQISLMQGHKGLVLSLKFLTFRKLLVSGSHDKTIRFWNFAGKEILQLLAHKYGVFDIAISPNGKLLVSVAIDKVNVWNLDSIFTKD